MVNAKLHNDDDNDPNLQAFKMINELACPNSVRVKLPKGYSFQDSDGKDDKAWMDEALNQRDVLVFGIGGKTLDPSLGTDNPIVWDHAAVMAAALCDQDPSKPEGNEHCYYMIKNSWGLNCRHLKDTEDRKCDKNSGAILLTWSAIRSGLDGGARVTDVRKLAKIPNK
ncbi:MAG: hypothetical protein ABL927_07520 [Bdellovibrionales bacterium]